MRERANREATTPATFKPPESIGAASGLGVHQRSLRVERQGVAVARVASLHVSRAQRDG